MTSTAALQILAVIVSAQSKTSGGALKLEQAVYDVMSYDVALKIDPKSKSLKGTTVMEAKVVIPTATVLIDLDDPFSVTTVTDLSLIHI